MVLNRYRDLADKYLSIAARPFMKFHPDLLTVLSFILAIFAGYLIFASLLLPASFVILLSALFDALDGKVARDTGRASPRGDLLDHTLDRYSDIFILGGIMFSPYSSMTIGFFGLIGVLMASYMGTQAHALTGSREYGGLIGRADRMILLIVFPILQFFIPHIWIFTPLEILMIWFAVGGQITAFYRGFITWRSLSSGEDEGHKDKEEDHGAVEDLSH